MAARTPVPVPLRVLSAAAPLPALGLALGLALVAPPLAAHGASGERLPAAAPVCLQFRYGVGEPMAQTELLLLDASGGVAQRLQTDALGRACVLADPPGPWRAVADDGLGHRVELPLSVSPEGVVGTGATARAVSLPPRLLLGLLLASLVANAWLWWRQRRAAPATP
ncbi:MAG TPA: hypothetical protein VFV27_02155 [Nevskiaceae bacterium]|nr:hypothetical protein [Nevskiaceae bacterium]